MNQTTKFWLTHLAKSVPFLFSVGLILAVMITVKSISFNFIWACLLLSFVFGRIARSEPATAISTMVVIMIWITFPNLYVSSVVLLLSIILFHVSIPLESDVTGFRPYVGTLCFSFVLGLLLYVTGSIRLNTLYQEAFYYNNKIESIAFHPLWISAPPTVKRPGVITKTFIVTASSRPENPKSPWLSDRVDTVLDGPVQVSIYGIPTLSQYDQVAKIPDKTVLPPIESESTREMARAIEEQVRKQYDLGRNVSISVELPPHS